LGLIALPTHPALHNAAAVKGYLRIAQALLGAGADVDTKANLENGRTAINGAAELERVDMVTLHPFP
jgi:hypothetical protein